MARQELGKAQRILQKRGRKVKDTTRKHAESTNMASQRLMRLSDNHGSCMGLSQACYIYAMVVQLVFLWEFQQLEWKLYITLYMLQGSFYSYWLTLSSHNLRQGAQSSLQLDIPRLTDISVSPAFFLRKNVEEQMREGDLRGG